MAQKVVIVGGVAGGATAAARIRRLDEQAQIVVFERSGYVSYANCGLPYYIGGAIGDADDLTLQTPESFYTRFRVDMRVRHEVLAIHPDKKTVTVKNLATGRKPNTAELGLENAGVALTARGGVVTDGHLKTTAPNIYAMGDVVGGLQFTYISLDDYRIVRSAVLGDGSYTTGVRGAVPYSVFLDPPFSRVGMSEQEAVDKGYSVRVAKLSAAAIPKALVAEQPSGLLKAVIDEKTGQILGAHLFCEESHEMINLVKLAMDAKLPYTALRDMIFTHPTMSEALNDLFSM